MVTYRIEAQGKLGGLDTAPFFSQSQTLFLVKYSAMSPQCCRLWLSLDFVRDYVRNLRLL